MWPVWFILKIIALKSLQVINIFSENWKKGFNRQKKIKRNELMDIESDDRDKSENLVEKIVLIIVMDIVQWFNPK